jgi:glyoxylase-like metal-dependent hydrolase (beta-lactamase superfamily II)
MITARVASLACLAACAGAGTRNNARPDLATQAVEEAIRAIGGRDAVEAARTVVLTGEGEELLVGQGPTLDHDWLSAKLTELSWAFDLEHGRWRQRRVVTPAWAAQDPAPSVEVAGLDGAIAFDVDPDGGATRALASVARDRSAELYHTALGILRAASVPGAVSNLRRGDGGDIVDVRVADGRVFALTLDPATRLPARIASASDDSLLGDVVVETELAGYQPAGALRLPTQITSKIDHQRVAVLRVTSAVNAAVGDLAAPAAVVAAPAAAPAAKVITEQLAPGVWQLAGGSHHSVVIELADHLLLIEAPFDDARMAAVLAETRALRPGKPLTVAVCTHHHGDHVGGVRFAVAQGIAIIAQARIRPFLDQLVARPHTRVPDALSRAPRPLVVETVAEERTIEDPAHPVQLFALPTGHADSMLVAYLPRERLLIEADLFVPMPLGMPALANPQAGALLKLVESRHLGVDRVISLHQANASFADLVVAAKGRDR